MQNRDNNTNENREKNINKNNGGKAGMYLSLMLCVVALAVGTFTAINHTTEPSEPQETTVMEVAEIVTRAPRQTTTSEAVTTTTRQATTTAGETTTAAPVANHFTLPVGGTITKEFDNENLQFNETFRDWRLHLGVNIAARQGTDVHSAGKGTVTRVYTDDFFGATVEIDHGNSILGIYNGLAEISVRQGDVVEIGQKIAVIGENPSTLAERPHLHFAVRKNGEFVDPIATLNLGS